MTIQRETVYLISSLRGDAVRGFAEELRECGFDVFDDWHAAGSAADDIWQEYERFRGRSYLEALKGYHAKHAFDFDRAHIMRADFGVLLMPAGKSAHLELGFMLGQRKRGYVLFDKEPERWDLMYQFATGVFINKEALFAEIKQPGQMKNV